MTFTFAEVERALRESFRGEFSTAPILGKVEIAVIDGEQIMLSYTSQQREPQS